MDEAEAEAARAAKKVRLARLGAAVLGLLLGAVFFPGPVSMVGFLAAAVLWWGKALGMIGLFGLAMAVAFFATASKRAAPPSDELTPFIGPDAEAPVASPAPAPPPGGGRP